MQFIKARRGCAIRCCWLVVSLVSVYAGGCYFKHALKNVTTRLCVCNSRAQTKMNDDDEC